MWNFGKRRKRQSKTTLQNQRWRSVRGERLEPRCLMAANPLHVGLVYLETDYLNTGQDQGSDTLPDRFILSFTGGEPDTELTEVRISTDKDNDGLSVGDLIFDTVAGGRGKGGAHPFRVSSIKAANPAASATAVVDDGGTLLVLTLTHFRAGDTLEFTLDVDEVLRLSSDLAIFNSRLDEIASGQEFQDSILTASFSAPHYETAVGQDVFENDYGNPRDEFGLKLPPDQSGDPDSRPNRTAAAIATTIQVPKPISIGGQVFVDDNLNLIREAGETLLVGIEVALWKKNDAGQYVDTGFRSITDSQGKYQFGVELGLMPGEYRLIESQPTGYFSVGAIAGKISGTSSGSIASKDSISDILIPLGDLHGVNYDFAEARPAAIKGYVYRDDSDDGVRNAGEPGLPGVSVRLEPISTIAPQSSLTVVTKADGSYAFENLSPGEYRIVEVTQPTPLTDGLDTAGTVNGIRVGVAQNPGDQINGIKLLGGQSGVEYNFGELPLGSLSGFVFLPRPGEDCDDATPANWIPVAGALVQIFNASNTLVAETRTAADGSYRFQALPKGEYRIEQFTPAGLIDGAAHVGTITGVRVGVAGGGGQISAIRLPAGKDGTHYDFCEAAPAKLSGYVYHDASNEGRRDSGEKGIPGATVRLLDASGTVVATAITNEQGYYEFTNLLPGTYHVEELTPAGYLDGIDRAGTVAGGVSGQATNPGDAIRNVVLRQGQGGVEYNFGELVPASIEGLVHADRDGDCELDPDEQALEGVVVQLYDSAGVMIAETKTDSAGKYRFGGLRPGKYSVVQIQPAGYFTGSQHAGSTGGNATVENRISDIPLVSAANSIENDFCEHPPSKLSGRVHADRDGDCMWDSDEPLLANVRIELLDAAGNVLRQTVTDANGRYEFDNLPKGKYTVRETQPVGYLQGSQTAGSGGGNAQQQDQISEIAVGWGESLIEYNFCELEPASITGTVFVDSNGDCIHQPEIGETALAGVTIRLHDATGKVIATTITNAQGRYTFGNLRPAEYQISEVQPTGYYQGGQVVGSGGGIIAGDDYITAIRLLAAQDLVDYDFCELLPGSLAGMVFADSNDDCVYDPALGETAISGVTIQLIDASGTVVASTQTDTAGRYRFANLRPGSYSVRELQPSGFFQGGQRIGSAGGRVGGVDLITEIPVGAGQNLIDYDFCELLPGSLQGVVYVDSNRDCIYQPEMGETPIRDVTVELRDADGRIVATTRTDAAGRYRFENLAPGVYAVTEIQPAGFYQGGQRIGSGGGRVAAADQIVEIPVGPGHNLVNYDFCELGPSSLSGRVWSDANLNRNFDNDERPISGVLIELLDAQQRVVATTRTDAAGVYSFTDLAPGEYSVRESQPDGYFQGGQIAGSHGGVATTIDQIVSIVIPGGSALTEYNFPEQPPAIISGYVFQDGGALSLTGTPDAADLRRYRDGMKTADDTPLAGVRLQLRRTTGQPVESTAALPGIYAGDVIEVVTDEYGYYEFTGIRGGAYSVYQIQPEGFVDGLDTEGTFGGLAVNAADLANDPELSFLVQTLSSNAATNPNFDAILQINLFAGTHSQSNNFSEIVIDPPTPVPPVVFPPPPVPDRPQVLPEQFDRAVPYYLASTPNPYKPYELGTWASGVTWHLSIINGGSPRGQGLDEGAIFRPASSADTLERWTVKETNVGQARLFDAEGNALPEQREVTIGIAEGIVLIGDFNGDGRDEFAVFVGGQWLIDLNGNGAWDQGDLWVQLGTDMDRPVVGDWDGDGKDDVGIFGPEWRRDAEVIPHDPGLPDPENRLRRGRKNTPPTIDEATDGQRLLQRTRGGELRADLIDHVFRYGTGADQPLAGDWNGDGIDAVAVFRNGQWLLDLDGDGRWTDRDAAFDFGSPGDVPIVADFNNDGIDELAIVRGDLWIIDSDGDRRLTAADTQIRIPRKEGEVPIAGDWDGDGAAQPGYYRPGAADDQRDAPAA
jgi:protocatechuate 3,4-dioxygenase beta subunit